MKEQPKLFVVKKYIMANSASHAIRKDKTTPVSDVWMDEDWKQKNLTQAIGYSHTKEPEEN